MKKHFIPGLLSIFLLFSCSNDKKEQKEEQISVRTTANETDMDSVANSIKENMTFSQLASNPNSVILTGLKEHRLVSVYKSRGNDISFDENIGYSSTSSSDLASQIGDMILSGGVIQDRIDSEKSAQSDLTNRKTTLQEKLLSVQARYTAQFASLDALLFKLQGTSDSLKSALDGLTNSQKNN